MSISEIGPRNSFAVDYVGHLINVAEENGVDLSYDQKRKSLSVLRSISENCGPDNIWAANGFINGMLRCLNPKSVFEKVIFAEGLQDAMDIGHSQRSGISYINGAMIAYEVLQEPGLSRLIDECAPTLGLDPIDVANQIGENKVLHKAYNRLKNK